MTPFQELEKIDEYLRDLQVSGCEAFVVTNQTDAVRQLESRSGIQILKARPEMTAYATSSSSVSTAFFVLEKHLGNAYTPEGEDEQYVRLLKIAESIMSSLESEIAKGCNGLLSGIDIDSYTITPESSIFGSWLGWIIEITFE